MIRSTGRLTTGSHPGSSLTSCQALLPKKHWRPKQCTRDFLVQAGDLGRSEQAGDQVVRRRGITHPSQRDHKVHSAVGRIPRRQMRELGLMHVPLHQHLHQVCGGIGAAVCRSEKN